MNKKNIDKTRISRVALFADYLSGLGGTEFYMVQLAILLKEQGVDVKLFTGIKPSTGYWLDILKKYNIETYYSDISYVDRKDRNPENILISKIEEMFSVWSPDIIHACPLGKLMLTWIEKSNLKIPIVGTEMTTPSTDTEHWYWPDLKEKINKLKTVITWCNESNRGVVKYLGYKGDTAVIPHFIPSPTIDFSPPNKVNNSIACISRLSPEKGLDFLIAAMLAVVKSNPKITLHIYGDGKDRDRLDYLVKSLSLGNNVFFEGVYEPITGIELVAARHSIFVQPSLFESIPTTVLELLARKRVIIATKVGGVPELFKGSGGALLVDRASTDQLSGVILRVAGNIQLQNKLATKGNILFNSKYQNAKSVQKYLNVYEKVLNKA